MKEHKRSRLGWFWLFLRMIPFCVAGIVVLWGLLVPNKTFVIHPDPTDHPVVLASRNGRLCLVVISLDRPLPTVQHFQRVGGTPIAYKTVTTTNEKVRLFRIPGGFNLPLLKPLTAVFSRWMGFHYGPHYFTGYRMYNIQVPHWALVLPALTFLLIPILLHALLRRSRQSRGLCCECGYDLRSSPDQCPECGVRRTSSAKT